jgi:hypothetical protein
MGWSLTRSRTISLQLTDASDLFPRRLNRIGRESDTVA